MRRYGLEREPIHFETPTLGVEQAFTTKNPAPVIIMNASGEGRRATKSMWDLTRTYSALFSRSEALPSAENARRRRRSFDDFDWEAEQQFEASFGEPGDNWARRKIRKDEAENIAGLLFAPPTDLEVIRSRQEIIRSLAASPDLDRLVDLKNQSYDMIEGLWTFWTWHGQKYHEEYFILTKYYDGVTEIGEWDEDDRFHEKPTRMINIPEIVHEHVELIQDGAQALKDFARVAQETNDPSIQKAFGTLPQVIDYDLEQMRNLLVPLDMQPVEPGKVDFYDTDRSRLNNFHNGVLEHQLFSMGAAIELARRVRDHGWAEVTFDPEQPAGYTGGWNMESLKKGQVTNGMPLDNPITILSGANTSGKSHKTQADLLIHLAAQATGHAPVESGNFRTHDSFVKIDRAATDPDNDMSAFVREANNWKVAFEESFGTADPHLQVSKAAEELLQAEKDAFEGMSSFFQEDLYARLDEIRQAYEEKISRLSGKRTHRTRFWVDEGFSTTSPEDQARLLLAVAEYIKNHGGSMVLATHSERVLDRAEIDPSIGVFNLKSEIGPDGRLIRHFTLQEGRADSGAVAASKSENFPDALINLVERHLQGEELLLPVPPEPDFPPVTSATEEERAQGKNETRSLEHLFPEHPQNPLLHLYSQDPDMRVERFVRNLKRTDKMPFGRSEAGDIALLVGEMIVNVTELTPSQILERQKIFTELLQNSVWQDINSSASSLMMLDTAVSIIYTHSGFGLNRALHPFVIFGEKTGQETHTIQFRKEQLFGDLQASVAFLRLNQKLLGPSFPHTDLLKEYEEYLASHPENGGENLPEEGRVLLKRMEGVLSDLPKLSWAEITMKGIEDDLQVLANYRRGEIEPRVRSRERTAFRRKDDEKSGRMWNMVESFRLSHGGVAEALQEVTSGLEQAEELYTKLKATDSVHLHQIANFIRQHIDYSLGLITDAPLQHEQKNLDQQVVSRFNHINEASRSRWWDPSDRDTSPLSAALQQIHALCYFTSVIEKSGMTPVTLNDTGEVTLTNAWNIFRRKDNQVRNTVSFGGNKESIQLLTGPNGSGKTFYEKGTVAAIQMAMATGFVPADTATLPVFDAVAYLDRVTEKQEDRFSSFSQELAYWKDLLQLLTEKKAVFAGVDEAFSTTSPTYQEAFALAIIMEFLSRNQTLMLSTHNHSAVDKLQATGTPDVRSYFFQFHVDDGEMIFDRNIREGHQKSHALEVAQGAGLPIEIVNLARA